MLGVQSFVLNSASFTTSIDMHRDIHKVQCYLSFQATGCFDSIDRNFRTPTRFMNSRLLKDMTFDVREDAYPKKVGSNTDGGSDSECTRLDTA